MLKSHAWLFIIAAICQPFAAYGEPADQAEDNAPQSLLVEDFTATTLEQGGWKIGSSVDFGLLPRLMVGTDIWADAVGAPSVHLKANVWSGETHSFAVGLRGTYLDRSTALWGSAREHFSELEARVLRPSIVWTRRVSKRLNLHTSWAVGIGRVHAELSETGKRRLWEAKHPDGDYDKRETGDAGSTGADDPDSGANQEKKTSEASSSFSQSTLQAQSVTGLASDLFQITGEFRRDDGNLVVIATRIERLVIEELTAQAIRLTAAQQWIWPRFQLRLGIGAQYMVISGEDLDGEEVDDVRIAPASDVAFYWML